MAVLANARQIHESYGRLVAPNNDALDALVILHERLLEEAAAHHDLGWRPARARLHRFADYAYGGIGFEVDNDFLGTVPSPTDPAPLIVKAPAAVHTARQQIVEWINVETRNVRGRSQGLEIEWAALLHEPADIGGVFLDIASATPPIRVSNQSTRVSWRAPALATWLDQAPASVLEIGGGHGRFLRDCALLMPETRLFLTDLPFNLIVQARYLREYFGDAVNLCLVEGQDVNPNARINLVAPWRLDRIAGPVEVAANFLSFQHMDQANLEWYGAAIETLAVEHLFHFNRAGNRDPHDFGADDYPFRAGFRIARREEGLLGQRTMADGSLVEIRSVLELLSRDRPVG
jgi:putative sugar O-methyltransferase